MISINKFIIRAIITISLYHYIDHHLQFCHDVYD